MLKEPDANKEFSREIDLLRAQSQRVSNELKGHENAGSQKKVCFFD